MSAQCVIVNMTQSLDCDRNENQCIIPPHCRPKYVHDDLESAEKEALRLHKLYGGPVGRFVIFQAIQATAWRMPFEIAASPVAVLEPYAPPVPVFIPAKAQKKKRKKL